MTKTVVILSGGTGGHVLPSVYLGNHLIEKRYNCILVTDKRGSQYADQFVGKIKIISASIQENKGNPSTILNKQFELGCLDGSILPSYLQREGKKIMYIEDFLRGFSFTVGDSLNV